MAKYGYEFLKQLNILRRLTLAFNANERMKILLTIICLFSFMLIKSQSIELSDFKIRVNYEKNCDSIEICMDSINCMDNTLSFSFHIKDNLSFYPERKLSYEFEKDTLFINYFSEGIEKDSIVFNTITKEYDTLKCIAHSISMNDFDAGCKEYCFEFKGFNNKPQIVYNHKIVSACPLVHLSYSIYKGDTINIVNKNGYKEGKWVDLYETGEILKIKEYKNGQFIKGNMYDKTGKITHVVSESGIEMAIPIEFYKETNK